MSTKTKPQSYRTKYRIEVPSSGRTVTHTRTEWNLVTPEGKEHYVTSDRWGNPSVGLLEEIRRLGGNIVERTSTHEEKVNGPNPFIQLNEDTGIHVSVYSTYTYVDVETPTTQKKLHEERRDRIEALIAQHGAKLWDLECLTVHGSNVCAPRNLAPKESA